jgi:crotonobetainyl-CoA:carnitine CoA-transferase CaiB-like acyl-CoA transferase
MTKPLSYIRVLDLSRVLAGPLATQFLADMGAEVIKVERPGEGDDTRGWGPPFAVPPTPGNPGLSTYFMAVNRGKYSVTIDFTRPEGQRIIRDLAAKCDVLVENFKVGGLAKYGLDYPSLRAINPLLVYCSITGFGQTGPYAQRAGYDFIVQGMGGLMSITGQPDGTPGAGPMKSGVALCDEMAGLNALAGMLTALLARERTGEGAYIDVSLLDATVAALINQASSHLLTGRVPARVGNAHPTIVPYEAFATADGDIVLAVGNDGQFRRFCEAVGIAGLADDERYRTNAQRVHNRKELVALIATIIAGRTSAQWIELLEPLAVPCGPINNLDDVFADPQVVARSLARQTSAGAAAPLPVVANPVRVAGADTTAAKAPPLLGEDTDHVLGAVLGFDADEIAALRAAHVI